MKDNQAVVQGLKYLLEKISMRDSDPARASVALTLLTELNKYATHTGTKRPDSQIGTIPTMLLAKIIYELEKMGYKGAKEIIFTKNIAESFETDAIIFEAVINGKKLVCRISFEALEDNFRNNQGNSHQDTFYKNIKIIEDKAIIKIQRGEYTFGNGLTILNTDF